MPELHTLSPCPTCRARESGPPCTTCGGFGFLLNAPALVRCSGCGHDCADFRQRNGRRVCILCLERELEHAIRLKEEAEGKAASAIARAAFARAEEREACARYAETLRVDQRSDGSQLLALYHRRAEELGDPATALREVLARCLEVTMVGLAETIRTRL